MKCLLSVLLFGSAFAQSTVQIRPDCGPVAFTFTNSQIVAALPPGTLNTVAYRNLPDQSAVCDIWQVKYSMFGLSAATVTFEDAPDTSTGAGTWETFAGTVSQGSNPNTSTTSAFSRFSGVFAWLRVSITGMTCSSPCSIAGIFEGYRSSAKSSSGGGGSGITQLTGDVTAGPGSGSQAATVDALQGVPVTNAPFPAIGQILTYDGVAWTPTNPSAGVSQVLFPTNTASADIATYDLLDTVPLGTQSTFPVTITSGSGKTLIKPFATASGVPNTSLIPAGDWQADTYIQTSTGTATDTLSIDVYKRNLAGTETLLFSFPDQTISGGGTGIQLKSTTSVQPSFAVLTTDRIIVKYLATTSHAGSVTVTLYIGGNTNYSHVHTTLGGPSGNGITELTGDGSAGPGSGSQALTLATVNSGSGSCGDSTHVCAITTNPKGLVISQTPTSITAGGPTTNQNTRAIGWHFDGGGSAITTTQTGCYRIGYSGTIVGWHMDADIAGSGTISVRTTAFASYTGVAGFSGYTDVTGGGTAPSLATAVTSTFANLTSWTTSFSAGLEWCFQLTSPSTCTFINVMLDVVAD